MGQIFEKTNPAHALDWTGERLTSVVSGQIEIEHLHRYLLACELSRGCDVLDIACGEGYGSALLAQAARSVIGMDVSAQAVAHARAAYAGPNIRFQQGDARKIDLPDASVNRLVSFETLEHFYDHDAFMTEALRVLRPDGMLIVSSPERDVYSPAGSSANPYHVRELSRAEFETLLQHYFPSSRILSQRPILGSVLVLDDAIAPTGTTTFEKRGNGYYESNEGLPRAPYLVAVASRVPITTMPNSIFIETDRIGELLSAASGAANPDKRLAVAQSMVEHLRLQIEMRDGELDRLRADLGRLDDARTEIELLRSERDLLRTTAGMSFATIGFRLSESQAMYRNLVELRTKDLEQERDAWKGRYERLAAHLEHLLRRTTPRRWRSKMRSFVFGPTETP